ncbi:MAG: menaquinone biosynthesis decarboxylase [Rikenellaceae bacterium]|nr:menaquinone biosynthesis decarboxylase [Rikenellaceae bacterium]
MYKSLGEFIDRLERADELIRIGTPVSSELEIAEITDRIVKSEGGGKALLFENTDKGFPVLTNLYGSERRMAMALGVERLEDISERLDALIGTVTSPKENFVDKLRLLPLLGEVSQWFPRKKKGAGACQQVVLEGEEAKLSLLPILKCWPHDGGRFVTLPMVHTVDPNSGIRNVGMYRMQVFDDYTTGMHWHRHKTGARHYEAYKAQGKRMPVSVAIGGDPVYAYSATAPVPDNIDEYLLAGLLRGKPVKLVKCVTNDIYVPEDCDFVIEGYVDTSEDKVLEGDFGDHTGFYSLKDYYPKFHVTAITHRRDAVYPATIVGVPPQEDAYIAMATERIFLAPIRLVMQPEVEDMTMPSAGTQHNITIISMRQLYERQASKVALGLWGAGQMMFNKYLLLTPASTNVRSPKELAALLRNCDLRKSLIRSEGIYDVLDHATSTCGFGGKVALDLTNVAEREQKGAFKRELLPEGVVADTTLLEEWSTLLLFADNDLEIDLEKVAEGANCNFVAIFDKRAKGLTAEELLWLGAANTEPKRDITLCGATLVVDARAKRGEGAPVRWPNVVVSDDSTIAKVDSRWKEYGLGEFVESLSLRYRSLLLSDGAEW